MWGCVSIWVGWVKCKSGTGMQGENLLICQYEPVWRCRCVYEQCGKVCIHVCENVILCAWAIIKSCVNVHRCEFSLIWKNVNFLYLCDFYSKMDGAVVPLVKWAKPGSDKHTFVLQVESRNEEMQLIVKVENWERRMRWGGVERSIWDANGWGWVWLDTLYAHKILQWNPFYKNNVLLRIEF